MTTLAQPKAGQPQGTRSRAELVAAINNCAAARALTDPGLGTGITGPTCAYATDIWTLNAHGMLDGQKIQFSSLTGGTGVSINTDYYVRDVTDNTFKISATLFGDPVNVTVSNVTASTLRKYAATDVETLLAYMLDEKVTYPDGKVKRTTRIGCPAVHAAIAAAGLS